MAVMTRLARVSPDAFGDERVTQIDRESLFSNVGA